MAHVRPVLCVAAGWRDPLLMVGDGEAEEVPKRGQGRFRGWLQFTQP